MKVVADLEGQHRIIELAGAHLVNVLARRQRVLVVLVARHATAGHDGAKIKALAELLPRVIQSATDAHALKFRTHADLDAVKRIALLVVRGELEAAGDLAVGVAIPVFRILDDEGKSEGHQLSVVLHADLPLWKRAVETQKLLRRP